MSSITTSVAADRDDLEIRGAALALAATLSLIAAGVHMLVTPEHLAAWWGYGAFFVAVTNAELALACLLMLRPSARLVHAGLWSTLATLLMYLVSRTAGVPLGPDAGLVEEVEALGIIASVSEAALLVVLAGMLGARSRSRTLTAFAGIAVALWMAALSGVLPPGVATDGHAHGQHQSAAGGHASGHEPVLPVIPDSVRNGQR
jgi:hypothetical protein